MGEEWKLYKILETTFRSGPFRTIGVEAGSSPECALARYKTHSHTHSYLKQKAEPVEIRGFQIVVNSLEQTASS